MQLRVTNLEPHHGHKCGVAIATSCIRRKISEPGVIERCDSELGERCMCFLVTREYNQILYVDIMRSTRAYKIEDQIEVA